MTGQLVDNLEDWRLPHNFTEALVVELYRRSGWKLSRLSIPGPGRGERTVDSVVERVRELYPRFPVEAVRPTIQAVVNNFPAYTITDVFAAFVAVASQQPNLLLLVRHQYDQAMARQGGNSRLVLRDQGYAPFSSWLFWNSRSTHLPTPILSTPLLSPAQRVGLAGVVMGIIALASYCSSPHKQELQPPSSQAVADNHNQYKHLEATAFYGIDSARGRGNNP